MRPGLTFGIRRTASLTFHGASSPHNRATYQRRLRREVPIRINEKGLALIKRWEGCELTAYRCPAKVLTIGYGHTGPDVKEGMTIAEAEAEALLLKDLARFENGVSAILGLSPVTSDQFSALVSFSFNLGLHALLKSTLLKKHKARDYAAAADQFRQWNKARVNGQLVPLAGLTARREAERNLYLGIP